MSEIKFPRKLIEAALPPMPSPNPTASSFSASRTDDGRMA